ncbi:MAG: type II CRISPR-associated endonuclease Cas1 [Bacteroidota bacterium]|nr:type II CRISPR-associated endonuclease Cas1 [Bacteroidota bacterium]MDP4233076.1 type II CRISPR-associated endonuclease Cas1 [Bacteroidota bacterium]MDP4241779.1 type II CRISPR-associated endonuclease Cas1 [Bacteroidota bacterium]MDP4289429.1 type II CRISPR-associated endonuclease Cas1 [Bacteroidota bacterium]
MIRRTLYFGNAAYLSTKDNQLVVERRLTEEDEHDETTCVPIEDIGCILLDHWQITITQPLLRDLMAANVAVVSCDDRHMPCGMFLPLAGSGVQPERFKYQLRSPKPLRKQLWAQTIDFKVRNQASLLAISGTPSENMLKWASEVRSGDTANIEGRAAVFYWANLFPAELNFRRDRDGDPPNNLLNYGYAVLRSMTAQALVASGMLPTLGIHHRNKYNAYPLADDIMEPYRPFLDAIVLEIVRNGEDFTELSKSIKQQLLSLATLDVVMAGKRRPLHVAMQRTAASLAFCFLGERRKILYPEFPFGTEPNNPQLLHNWKFPPPFQGGG